MGRPLSPPPTRNVTTKDPLSATLRLPGTFVAFDDPGRQLVNDAGRPVPESLAATPALIGQFALSFQGDAGSIAGEFQATRCDRLFIHVGGPSGCHCQSTEGAAPWLVAFAMAWLGWTVRRRRRG